MRFASQATTLATLLAGACYTATVHAAGRKLMTGFEETGTIFASEVALDLLEPEEIKGESAPRKGSFEASIRRKAIAAPHKCSTYDSEAEDFDFDSLSLNNVDSQIVFNDKSGATLHVACYQDVASEFVAPNSYVFWELPTDGAWFWGESQGYVTKTSPIGRKRFDILNTPVFGLGDQFTLEQWLASKADGSVAYQGAGYVMAIPTIEGLHQGNASVLFTLTFDVTKARPSVYKSKNAPFKLLSNITFGTVI